MAKKQAPDVSIGKFDILATYTFPLRKFLDFRAPNGAKA
jgi:hypothetical protein